MDLTRFIPQEIKDAQVIFWSHSGGADSQAGLALLKRMGLLSKVVMVHADLGEMEWHEMAPWIEKTSFGLPVNVVKSEMDFFQMVRKYGRLPSGHKQFCTDFLKTQPIEAFIHDYMDKHGLTKAINATGMRGQESKRRKEKEKRFFRPSVPVLKSDMKRPRKHPGHEVVDWMPIFYYSFDEVREEIDLAGQKPHKLYGMGFSRLSCVLCVNGRIGEHQEAAKRRPELARKMANLEREIGKAYRLKQRNKIKYPKFMDEYLEALKPGYQAEEKPCEIEPGKSKTLADIEAPTGKGYEKNKSFFNPKSLFSKAKANFFKGAA